MAAQFDLVGWVSSMRTRQYIILKTINKQRPADGRVITTSCCAGKYCSNLQNVILNSSGVSKGSKCVRYVELDFERHLERFDLTDQCSFKKYGLLLSDISLIQPSKKRG